MMAIRRDGRQSVGADRVAVQRQSVRPCDTFQMPVSVLFDRIGAVIENLSAQFHCSITICSPTLPPVAVAAAANYPIAPRPLALLESAVKRLLEVQSPVRRWWPKGEVMSLHRMTARKKMDHLSCERWRQVPALHRKTQIHFRSPRKMTERLRRPFGYQDQLESTMAADAAAARTGTRVVVVVAVVAGIEQSLLLLVHPRAMRTLLAVIRKAAVAARKGDDPV